MRDIVQLSYALRHPRRHNAASDKAYATIRDHFYAFIMREGDPGQWEKVVALGAPASYQLAVLPFILTDDNDGISPYIKLIVKIAADENLENEFPIHSHFNPFTESVDDLVPPLVEAAFSRSLASLVNPHPQPTELPADFFLLAEDVIPSADNPGTTIGLLILGLAITPAAMAALDGLAETDGSFLAILPATDFLTQAVGVPGLKRAAACLVVEYEGC